jgi:hypothetical protein
MPPTGEITIAATFNGPPASGNGGYAAGLLAGYDPAQRIVRVLSPIPLGAPLSVSLSGGTLEARHGDTRILAARPGTVTLTPPPPPTLEAARDAATRPTSFGAGGPSTCFVCGRNRAPGEGLHIHCGRLDDTRAASVWTPHPNFCDAAGHVRPEYLWAALDCPGGFALPLSATTFLLGEMTALQHRPVTANTPVIVHAWHVWSDGRKHFAGTALHDADGALVAQADTLWIELTPAQAKGLAS